MATPNLKVVEVLGVDEQSQGVWWKEVPPYGDDGTWKPFADRPGLGLEVNPDSLKNNVIG
jgi:hypothetical protein